MSANKRFSKDEKVYLVSVEEFLNNSEYLSGITDGLLWKDDIRPAIDGAYFKLTSEYLICVFYGSTAINFGNDLTEKLLFIEVARRDGKTEYELFDKKLNALKDEKAKHRRSKKLDAQILELEKARAMLPEYGEKNYPSPKSFESYLKNTGYQTTIDKLKNKYIVFDVETNGTRKSSDDLL